MERYIIHSDGGARKNPGPAAIGFVLYDPNGKLLAEAGETIGETTNNVAEYKAAIAALKKLKALLGGDRATKASVEVRMDSELVVKQLHGQYKIRDLRLGALFIDLWNTQQDFAGVVFRHIPREENKEADRLVNEALDGKSLGNAPLPNSPTLDV